MARPTLFQTLEFMAEAHGEHVDKAGMPYWLHPIRVMIRLGADANEEERQVALLHDVLEDTQVDAMALHARGFSGRVICAVELLTRPPAGTSNRPTYIEWIKSIAKCGNSTAIKVKIADNEDNLLPERIAALPPGERNITSRYERSIAILKRALPTPTPENE